MTDEHKGFFHSRKNWISIFLMIFFFAHHFYIFYTILHEKFRFYELYVRLKICNEWTKGSTTDTWNIIFGVLYIVLYLDMAINIGFMGIWKCNQLTAHIEWKLYGYFLFPETKWNHNYLNWIFIFISNANNNILPWNVLQSISAKWHFYLFICLF